MKKKQQRKSQYQQISHALNGLRVHRFNVETCLKLKTKIMKTKKKNNDDDAKERQMLGCEPGVAAITREKGAADVTAWGAHRPDHRPHQDGDDDG